MGVLSLLFSIIFICFRSVERYSEVDEVTETTKLKTDFEKGKILIQS